MSAMEALKPALVIVAHGSRQMGWSDEVDRFTEQLKQEPGIAETYGWVQSAFLEHSRPDLGSVVSLALSAGCPDIVVAPLFLTASNHVSQDLPVLLGLKELPHVRQQLEAEGLRTLPPGLPIRMLALDDWGNTLKTNVLQRCGAQGVSAKTTGVVLCGHGSSIHHERWEATMSGLTRALTERGFGRVAHAYVGHCVGRSPQPTVEAIESVATVPEIELVLVVSLLMVRASSHTQVVLEACAQTAGRVPATVRYTHDAVLPDLAFGQHIAQRALALQGVYLSPVGRELS